MTCHLDPGLVWAPAGGLAGCHGGPGPGPGPEPFPGVPSTTHPAGAAAVQRHEGSAGQGAKPLLRVRGGTAEDEGGASLSAGGR